MSSFNRSSSHNLHANPLVRRKNLDDDVADPQAVRGSYAPLIEGRKRPPSAVSRQTGPDISVLSNHIIRRKRNEEDGTNQSASVQLKPGSDSHQISFDRQYLAGGGRPLSRKENSYFSARFGRNLDQVRIHNNSDAHRLSKKINARAFTVGSDIAFGPGEFQPDNLDGKRLIAHELTHVFQQQGRQLIQRKPLSDEKKEQLRITASKFALDDLNQIIFLVENLSEADRIKFIQEIEEIQAAAKDALTVIENSNSEHKVIFLDFIEKWSAAFDYEPFAMTFLNENRIWSVEGKQFPPNEFIKFVAEDFKTNPKGYNLKAQES